MRTDPEAGARAFMGLIMILLTCVGIALVGHASDDPMAVFGYLLMLFGIFYVFGLIRQHFDAIEKHKTSEQSAQSAKRLAAAAE